MVLLHTVKSIRIKIQTLMLVQLTDDLKAASSVKWDQMKTMSWRTLLKKKKRHWGFFVPKHWRKHIVFIESPEEERYQQKSLLCSIKIGKGSILFLKGHAFQFLPLKLRIKIIIMTKLTHYNTKFGWCTPWHWGSITSPLDGLFTHSKLSHNKDFNVCIRLREQIMKKLPVIKQELDIFISWTMDLVDISIK